ncbi:MAG TPA: glycosyltransferase family 39 protein [Kofleriaceae bacterium]|nr:glycosyltransferase family 39 protein [Kofleriaceae bacterium]
MIPPDRRDALLGAAVWAAVLALAAWSVWQRWELLDSSPYPVGVDGWYYPIQVRSLLERGELAYPAAPLTFWLMTPVALVTDPITAAKIIAALGGGVVAVPAFLLGRRVGGVAGGLVAAVLATTGGGSFYLSLEFVKNGLGLTVALTTAWLGLRALEQPTRARLALAALVLVLAFLTHKMSALLALALLAPAVAVELRARELSPRAWRVIGATLAAAAVVALVAGVLAPQRFIGPRDVALLDGAFTGPGEWELPALAVPHPGRPTYYLLLGHQGLIAAAAGAVFLAAAIASRVSPGVRSDARPAERALVWAGFALLAVTAWPWLDVADPDAVGFRLRVAAFAPASIVGAAAVGRLVATLELPWRLVAVAPALAAWVAVRPAAPTEGMVRTEIPMVAATAAITDALPKDAVIISAERHLGFQAVWFARVPLRLRPERVPRERRWRMIPLGIIGMGSPLDRALTEARTHPELAPPIGLHPGHPNGLVLVPEATWEWVLTRLPPRPQAWWREWHTR